MFTGAPVSVAVVTARRGNSGGVNNNNVGWGLSVFAITTHKVLQEMSASAALHFSNF